MKKNLCKKVSLIVALFMLLSSFLGTTAFALTGAGDLIKNHNFDDGVSLPWHVTASAPAAADFSISNDAYTVTPKAIIENGNRWDIQLRHRGLTIEQGHTYTVKFTVSATKDCRIFPFIGDSGAPYLQYWYYGETGAYVELTANTPVTITDTFTMDRPTANACELSFQMGGERCITSPMPFDITFDDIYLMDSSFLGYPDETPEPTNGIRVNQEGYYPKLAKVATLVSDATSPVAWELLNNVGTTVAQGQSTVKGFDHSSGEEVHTIDFSSYTTQGTGYTLVAGTSESMPFDIGNDMYETIKYDAMKYFYYNRSGIEIAMPYAGEEQLARPAGHPSDVLMPDITKDYSADYNLDVTGCWYDAGDYGKYVVNGGISAWTVMNEYERALHLDGDLSATPYADNTLNIPESGNGIPDILDEARWELEGLLKFQVPAGNTLAGMVHHKAHDDTWTGLALSPGQDSLNRYLQPPSTAATLNLAAIAAQGSRLWEEYDPNFSSQCLAAAETAWDAAVAYPNIYASPDNNVGGGPYSDDYVLDEFYWAASELYVSTGKAKYLDYINSSTYYLKMPTELTGGEDFGLTGCFDWGNTAGMGTISLAFVPNDLPAADVTTAKSNIKLAADKFISIANSQGYGVPIEEKTLTLDGGTTIVGFPWGSNSFVVNEAIVMAYAYEFSDKDTKYLNGVSGAMDYILGRNPNIQSYITGYGDNPLENPHHRFWAYQADNNFPKAPAGCLSGGPNSGLEDPWVLGLGWTVGERAAEKCFMDNIESFSTNEITINWNAPLAWVTAYLDEKGPNEVLPPELFIGDVNEDGSVDSIDFALLRKFLLTQDVSVINVDAADVNGDDSIDAVDFALVRSYLLKKMTKFPAEG